MKSCALGWLSATPSATAWSTVVLPALAGATISARCPLPKGQSRSMRRVISWAVRLLPTGTSSWSIAFGCTADSFENSGRPAIWSGGRSLTVATRCRLGPRPLPPRPPSPVMASPVRRPYCLTSWGGTKRSPSAGAYPDSRRRRKAVPRSVSSRMPRNGSLTAPRRSRNPRSGGNGSRSTPVGGQRAPGGRGASHDGRPSRCPCSCRRW